MLPPNFIFASRQKPHKVPSYSFAVTCDYVMQSVIPSCIMLRVFIRQRFIYAFSPTSALCKTSHLLTYLFIALPYYKICFFSCQLFFSFRIFTPLFFCIVNIEPYRKRFRKNFWFWRKALLPLSHDCISPRPIKYVKNTL